MALNIGDNFKYLGKKFLDARESFNTLEEMNACNDVPKGFITICYEDNKRYEYNGTVWKEYVVSGGTGGANIDMDDIVHYGTEDPTNDNVIWFVPDTLIQSEITYDNPILNELINTIRYMQSQITQLQEDVEYLKTHGGGSGGGNTPEPPKPTTYSYLVLEDGFKFLLEDGGGILLEEQKIINNNMSYLVLEDGFKFLLEDGGGILLEEQKIINNSSYLLLEDGFKFLLEDGGGMLLEA